MIFLGVVDIFVNVYKIILNARPIQCLDCKLFFFFFSILCRKTVVHRIELERFWRAKCLLSKVWFRVPHGHKYFSSQIYPLNETVLYFVRMDEFYVSLDYTTCIHYTVHCKKKSFSEFSLHEICLLSKIAKLTINIRTILELIFFYRWLDF